MDEHNILYRRDLFLFYFFILFFFSTLVIEDLSIT